MQLPWTLTQLISALLGPAATVAAGMYIRTAVIKAQVGDSTWGQVGAWVCAAVLSYIAFFRALGSLGMDRQQVQDWLFPMTIPAFGVHSYCAYRLGAGARHRGRLRAEAARQLSIVEQLDKEQP